jgi:hypothetical protein
MGISTRRSCGASGATRSGVWTAHDVLPAEPARSDPDRFASIYRAADLVVVHGETAAKEVDRLASVNPAIVEHVPDDTVRVDRGEARRRLGVPEDERVLGALGFIRAWKGYELFAHVWSSSATPPSCCWWWVR